MFNPIYISIVLIILAGVFTLFSGTRVGSELLPEPTPQRQDRAPASLPARSRAPSDAELARSLSHQISQNLITKTDARQASLKINVAEGIATLSGEVRDAKVKEKALDIAARTKGVRIVVDKISIQSAAR